MTVGGLVGEAALVAVGSSSPALAGLVESTAPEQDSMLLLLGETGTCRVVKRISKCHFSGRWNTHLS